MTESVILFLDIFSFLSHLKGFSDLIMVNIVAHSPVANTPFSFDGQHIPQRSFMSCQKRDL